MASPPSFLDSPPTKNIHFHPKALIDNLAIFRVSNPYPNETLEFHSNKDALREIPKDSFKADSALISSKDTKTYQGILTFVNYLGINQESLSNLTEKNSTIKTLQYKHFFSFKVESVLKRLSLNQASRIYTHTNILEVIKETLNFYQGLLHKEIDFSNISLEFENQELISQYKESDLDFITRLAHNNGIFFYEDANTIYFCNHYAKSAPKSIAYNPNINNILKEPCITQISKEQSLRTNAFIHSSMQASFPLNSLAFNSNKVSYEENLHREATYQEHTYENAYSFTQNIDLKTLPSTKERRMVTLNESFCAKSNVYHLSLKDFIHINYHSLTNHPTLKDSKDKQTDFVIIANTQTLIDDAILANSMDTNDSMPLQETPLSKSYSNTLTLLPHHLIFTPSLKHKPKAPNSTLGGCDWRE